VTAFIGFGSNLGDKVGNCRRAIRLLEGIRGIRVLRVSSLWLTEPWGYTEQEPFINGVLEIVTELDPRDLLRALKGIEVQMGRKFTFRWGPRVIDLDLLLYGQEVIEEEDLKVPHPLMHERSFVLVPLVEIAPWAYHPVKGKTARELLEEISGPRGVQYFGRFEGEGCLSSS